MALIRGGTRGRPGERRGNRVVELPEIDPGAPATIPGEWWELIPQVESAFAS
jgi:hypothetical protein